jgi:RNA polymerase sigma-54 factor
MMNSARAATSLYEHLCAQLGLLEMPEHDLEIAEFIIGCLDSKGYLSTPADELSQLTGVSPQNIEKIIAVIQNLHPCGVGARDLRECLLLQLPETQENLIARQIVTSYLEPLARGLNADIARDLGISKSDVEAAHEKIKRLNPRPGLQFETTNTEYVEADIEVIKESGEFRVKLLDQRIPRLRISSSCRQLLASGNLSRRDLEYIKARIRSASFLISGITQRDETLRKVAELIVRFQGDFIASREGQLKPLTMAKLASILRIHETTVSRAIANKHMRTPHGLLAMRTFFVQGYKCTDGSAFTPEAVKEMIQNMIQGENKGTPLRDVDIAAALRLRGLKLARRTIAKYREEIGIPSSKERSISIAGRQQRTAKPLPGLAEIGTKPMPVAAFA